MSMPAPRRNRREPDAPGLTTRSGNAKKHPGSAPGVQSQPRRTAAPMEEARAAAAEEAEKAEAEQKAALERVARIEDKQTADDDTYSENADHPPNSDYQALSSDYQDMDDSSEENSKLPDDDSMDEAGSDYNGELDMDNDSNEDDGSNEDEDEETQTGKPKRKKNQPKPTRQDIGRLRNTEDSSGTPKSRAESDVSAAKKRKAGSGGRADHKKKPKMTKKSGLIKTAKTTQRGASTVSGRSSVVTSEDESMFQYGGPALDNDENEKVETPVADKGKKRGLPSFVSISPFVFELSLTTIQRTIKATAPAPVKHTTKKQLRGNQDKSKDSDIPSEALLKFKTDVIPLSRELAGTLEPWLSLTVAQVQAIVDRVFGSDKYLVEKNGPWFELVTYRLTDWRSGFAAQAQKAMEYLIKDAKERAKGQQKLDATETEDQAPGSEAFDFTAAEGIADFCQFALTEHKPGDKKKSTMAFHWRTYGDGTTKEGFFLSYNILYTFAHHLNELATIPANYERSTARPVGALLLAAQAVERNLSFWKTGEYIVPKGSDWYFSRDNWSDIRQIDPKTGKTLVTRRATKYLGTVGNWTAERWDEQLEEAAVWKESKRQKKAPSAAASSDMEVIEIIDDDEDDSPNVASRNTNVALHKALRKIQNVIAYIAILISYWGISKREPSILSRLLGQDHQSLGQDDGAETVLLTYHRTSHASVTCRKLSDVINEYREAELRAANRPPPPPILVDDDDDDTPLPPAVIPVQVPPQTNIPIVAPPQSLSQTPPRSAQNRLPFPSPLLRPSPPVIKTPFKSHSAMNIDPPSSPWDMNCSKCGFVGHGSAAEGDTIQCDKCGKWSHVICMQILDPSLDTDDVESLKWLCPDCTDTSNRMSWNENLPGQYIMFKTRTSGKYYPAKVTERTDNVVNLEWYSGNSYAPHDKPSKSTFSKTPSECMAACGSVVATRYNQVGQFFYPSHLLWLTQTRGFQSNCGEIHWPSRLVDDAVGNHSYENQAISRALADAEGAIAAICLEKLYHPVWPEYQAWMQNKPKTVTEGRLAEYSRIFGGLFDLDILPGDYSLMESYISNVMRKIIAKGRNEANAQPPLDSSEHERRVAIDIPVLLFKLVILRVYLGRKEQLASIEADDPFAAAKCGHIIRHSTIPEQVLLAAEGVQDTRTAPRKSPKDCKLKAKTNKSSGTIPDNSLATPLDADHSPYVWGEPSSSGLYQKRTVTIPAARPKPRPKVHQGAAEANLMPTGRSDASKNLKRGRDDDQVLGDSQDEMDADPDADMDNVLAGQQDIVRKTKKRARSSYQ
ncbi:hypothetical protein K438DRAFT_1748385 [Mycena galopus ATCC 62051]|nr:hypothetical protein K438DRAFT_1748385 [Mycena galopus ATCC 62051]